jgi:CheY-like chemotaxis protein
LRVLIVDDEPEVADGLCILVTSWGHDVRQVYDGTSSLQVAADLVPNVVLLDIAMPDMDGYEVARQLRHRADLKGCFLVAMRAVGDRRGGPLMTETNIDLFLAKPMDSAVLETLLLMEGERLDRLIGHG